MPLPVALPSLPKPLPIPTPTLPLTASRAAVLAAEIAVAPGWRVVERVPWATCGAFYYVVAEAAHPVTGAPLLRSRRHLVTAGQWREHRAKWDAIRAALAAVAQAEACELVTA